MPASDEVLKILFDQSTPRPLARHLPKHSVTLALHAGLDRTPNGKLIKAAEQNGFEVLVTPDKNLGYQQNVRGRRIGIVVLPSGQWPAVQEQLEDVIEAVDGALPGSYREIPYRKASGPTPS